MISLRPLLAVAICLPAIAAAEIRCAWFNAATAGGVLGGAVNATVTSTSCEFVRQSSGHTVALRIEVVPRSAPHAQCGPGAEPLKAIGNEAQLCAGNGKVDVVGRVRDQAFLVRITTGDPTASAKILRDKARSVAEQVAGILF